MTSTITPEFTDAEIDAELGIGAPIDYEAPVIEVNTDADAPYGYKADGTPKRGPGGRPSGKAGRRPGPRNLGGTSSRPKGRQDAPKVSAPKRTAPRKPPAGGKDYGEGIKGLLHLLAVPLNFVSPLDAAAVLMNADELADAVNETAKERAEVAAMCEKMLKVGPYGLLIGAALKVGAQVAENHGWLPYEATKTFGAVRRHDLAAQMGLMVQHAEGQAEAAAA